MGFDVPLDIVSYLVPGTCQVYKNQTRQTADWTNSRKQLCQPTKNHPTPVRIEASNLSFRTKNR